MRVRISPSPLLNLASGGYLVAPKYRTPAGATLAVYAQAAACEATEMAGRNTGAVTGHRGASDHSLVSLGAC